MAQTIYTPTQLSSMMDAITLRVNLIDGQNLGTHLKGQLQELRMLVAGLKKTLGQVNLGNQTQNAAILTQVANLAALVNTISTS